MAKKKTARSKPTGSAHGKKPRKRSGKKRGECFLGDRVACWVTMNVPGFGAHCAPTFSAYGRAGAGVFAVAAVCQNTAGVPFAGTPVMGPPNWQVLFNNLPAGTYQVYVNGTGPNCSCNNGPVTIYVP